MIQTEQKVRELETAPILQLHRKLPQNRTPILGSGLEAVVCKNRLRQVFTFPILLQLLLQLGKQGGFTDTANTVVHQHPGMGNLHRRQLRQSSVRGLLLFLFLLLLFPGLGSDLRILQPVIQFPV